MSKSLREYFKEFPNIMPKSKIELYKIGKVLGSGGQGNVNLALHRLTRKLVAIKSISRSHLSIGDNR